jgi:hypothetical protein
VAQGFSRITHAAFPVDINPLNATRLHLFNGKPASEHNSRHKPGHKLYPHENNMQIAKALFPILYNISRGEFSPDQIVARALQCAAFTIM